MAEEAAGTEHAMPEVPGLVIEDAGRCDAKRIAKRIIAKQRPGRPDVIVGPELHELTEQPLRVQERGGRRTGDALRVDPQIDVAPAGLAPGS